MRTPKGLGRSVTEVRIVEAAVQLFSRQGFKGTSTREIAQLADVNEATLFRYFPRKRDLFWAAADSRLQRVKLSRDLQSVLANDADPQQTIPLIISFMCDSLLAHPETVRLLYVAGFELAGADRVLREHLGPIFDAISSYFSRCAAKGIIADFDPAIATLGVAGTVGAHHALRSLFTEHPTVGDVQNNAPEYAQFLLKALAKGDSRRPDPV